MMKVKEQNSWALKRLILNIKSLKEYLKGRKTSYFLFFSEDQIRRPFWGSGLSCSQSHVHVYKVLLLRRQIMY